MAGTFIARAHSTTTVLLTGLLQTPDTLAVSPSVYGVWPQIISTTFGLVLGVGMSTMSSRVT